jgi:peroxiredoxin
MKWEIFGSEKAKRLGWRFDMALTHTPPAELGSRCPDFTLPSLDGKTYSLKDFQTGHSLVVMFICNHCPYVKAIEERLIQLGKDLMAQKVSVVAICSNDEFSYPEDNFENLKKNYLAKKMPFVYLHDKTQEVAKSFGAVCTPDFFVYDKELRLAYRGRLDDSWKEPSQVTKRDLYNAVLTLEKNQPAPKEQLSSMGCSIKWLK